MYCAISSADLGIHFPLDNICIQLFHIHPDMYLHDKVLIFRFQNLKRKILALQAVVLEN